ncbi:MAG: SAM-dependent chlorinase/fluorinase [Fimbriimonadales bacterium]|nr:SAM-dependent chlorinase/fluorinase [Fimbriimonadales bacterium]
MSRLIALLTDYGYGDTYVAQVKAVLLRICPTCEILDLTHGIAPQKVRSGAYQLATATPYLPDGAIVIAVVDPGVGTARRAIAVQGARHTYLAPDNGLLCLALRDDPPVQAVVLDNPRYHLPEVSSTFHGRDIFAPCAAHLANGAPLQALGTALDPASLVQLPDLEPEYEGAIIRCKPLHIDHFGNVVFNLRSTDSPVRADASRMDSNVQATPHSTDSPVRVALLGTNRLIRAKSIALLGTDKTVRATLPLARTFGEVGWGEPLAYWGSNGYLEVAINGGSAAEVLGIDETSVLEVRLESE